MRNHMPVVASLLLVSACTACTASTSPTTALTALTAPEQAKLRAQSGSAVSASMPMDMGGASVKKADTPAQVAFDNLKKLMGRWEAPMGNNKTIVDTFQPFAFGTAILGEEWVDGKQITSTVFYLVGSELRADHYCDYLNQPRYVARDYTDPAVIDFEFRDATNLDTHPLHFHSTTWHFIDGNHLTQDWHVEGGPKGKGTVHMEFVRKDPDTPKTASRNIHGYESASFRRVGETQSMTRPDLRLLWRAARRLGYLAINVVAESLGLTQSGLQMRVAGLEAHGRTCSSVAKYRDTNRCWPGTPAGRSFPVFRARPGAYRWHVGSRI